MTLTDKIGSDAFGRIPAAVNWASFLMPALAKRWKARMLEILGARAFVILARPSKSSRGSSNATLGAQ